MAPRFHVTGGVPLKGRIRPAGNKNAALPLICATLLSDEPSDIRNVPRIRDVEALLELLADLGAQISWTEEHTLRIDPSGVRPKQLDARLVARIRASVLLAGP